MNHFVALPEEEEKIIEQIRHGLGSNIKLPEAAELFSNLTHPTARYQVGSIINSYCFKQVNCARDEKLVSDKDLALQMLMEVVEYCPDPLPARHLAYELLYRYQEQPVKEKSTTQ